MKRLPDGKFKIGFWNYGDINTPLYSDVKEWTDCGMTLPMSPLCGENDEEKVIKLLENCEKAGIGLILCDCRASYYSYIAEGEEKYRENIRKIYAAYGKYPAFNSIHLGDEPSTDEHLDACKNILRIVKEEMPDITPFLNLISISAGHFSHFFDSYEEFRDGLKALGFPLLAYDCYCQMGPNGIWTDVYFNNLLYFMNASKELNVEYWPSSLSVGHYNYRCPNEDDFRFQLNTAVASGCKGLFWFFFYMRRPHENYRVSPIDEHGERTETYQWLSRILRTFHKTYGDLFNNLELIDCRHAGDTIGNFRRFDGNEFIRSVSTTYTRSATASLFRDKRDGKYYFAVVNNSMNENGVIAVRAKGDKVKSLKLVIFGEDRQTVCNCPQSGLGEYTSWFAPGQMEVYELELR